MTNNNRYKRIRLLVHKVNKARKKQAKQINILCHDLIDAQRDYNRRLSTIGLAASFYKSILGIYDLETLLSVASGPTDSADGLVSGLGDYSSPDGRCLPTRVHVAVPRD